MDNKANEVRLEGNINTFELIMSVLALSAPLMTVASMSPLELSFGGTSGPMMFIITAVFFVVFSIGFVKMGMHMNRPGGFYAYVTAGLGKRAGLSVAFLAIVSYPGVGFVTCTYFGITASNLLLAVNGPDVPWWVFSLLCIVINTILAYHRVDLSVKVLSIVMAIEALIVIAYDIASFVHGGPEDGGGFEITMPWFTNASLGTALLFSIATFIGFEATIIYREEVREPEKTIPRATVLAVICIGVFYAIATAAMINMEGANRVQDVATNNLDTILNSELEILFDKIVADLSLVVIMFSSLASNLSVHNVEARYLYSLGHDGVLPRVLGKAHPKHKSPYVGALVMGIVWAVVTILLCILGVDAVGFYGKSSGLGTFGVLFIIFVTSIAVVAYFRKNPADITGVWTTRIWPIIAIVLMGICCLLAVTNFTDLLGASVGVCIFVVVLMAAILVAGYVYAGVLKNTKPEVYARIGREDV